MLGFWPRCPLSVGLSREHLFGLGSTWLGSAPNTWLRFWSACPPSVCPAPECLSGLCFEILDRGRHVPAPSGRDVGSNARAPTREPVLGTDPRNGSHLLEVSPCLSLAVSPLLGSLPGCSWRLRRPGWLPLVAGPFFVHEFLRGEAAPHLPRSCGSLTAEGRRSSAKSSQRISRLGRVTEETPQDHRLGGRLVGGADV